MYDSESPHLHPTVWEYIENNKIPVLGICYGMQEMAQHFGGVVSPSNDREFGRASVQVYGETKLEFASIDIGETMENCMQCYLLGIIITLLIDLFHGVSDKEESTEIVMWMSHGDKVTTLPVGFSKIAATANSDHAAIADGR